MYTYGELIYKKAKSVVHDEHYSRIEPLNDVMKSTGFAEQLQKR